MRVIRRFEQPLRLWSAVTAAVVGAYLASSHAPVDAQQQCVDHSKDPAGCQPSTFDTPMAQMPSVRVNRQGTSIRSSSEADAKAGAFELEKRLHLFRNFEHLHWVVTVPSREEPGDGRLAWRRPRRRRRRARAGHCRQLPLRRTRERRRRQARHQHLQDSARTPRSSRRCRSARFAAMVEGNEGFDDRELRALVYRTSRGEDRYLLVRNAGTNTLGPDADVPDRHEHVPADAAERGDGLPLAVARVLPLARPGQRQPRARLHDELDGRRAGSREPRPQGAGPHRPRGHR